MLNIASLIWLGKVLPFSGLPPVFTSPLSTIGWQHSYSTKHVSSALHFTLLQHDRNV